MCDTHKGQGFPSTYRFATRMLLVDWNGGQLWTTAFDEIMKGLLGFDANTFMAFVTDDDRREAMSLLLSTTVRVTGQRRTKREYTNYTVKTLEVVQKRTTEECVLNAGW